jgi:hypothetical protein
MNMHEKWARKKEIKINVSYSEGMERRGKLLEKLSILPFFLGFIVFRCNMLRNMGKFNDSNTRKNVLFTEKKSKGETFRLEIVWLFSDYFPVFFLHSSLPCDFAMFETLSSVK